MTKTLSPMEVACCFAQWFRLMEQEPETRAYYVTGMRMGEFMPYLFTRVAAVSLDGVAWRTVRFGRDFYIGLP